MVFDGVGGQIGQAAFEVTARGGRFFAYGVPSGEFAQVDLAEAEQRGVSVRGIEQVQFAPEDARRLAERVLAEAVAGRIRPVIGQTFPLERAADAQRLSEEGHLRGKIVITVP